MKIKCYEIRTSQADISSELSIYLFFIFCKLSFCFRWGAVFPFRNQLFRRRGERNFSSGFTPIAVIRTNDFSAYRDYLPLSDESYKTYNNYLKFKVYTLNHSGHVIVIQCIRYVSLFVCLLAVHIEQYRLKFHVQQQDVNIVPTDIFQHNV